MLEAALDQEVAKPIDHEWIGLGHDCLDNVVLLLMCADLKLLLQENGCLLVVVANNLVYNVFPVTSNVAVKEPAVVQRLSRGQKGLEISARLDKKKQSARPGNKEPNVWECDVLTSVFHGTLVVVNSDACGERAVVTDCCW